MKSKIFGYARVSTKEQNEQRQVSALKEYGIVEENIFIDKQSGKNFERDAYRKMLRKMKAGDVLVVKSIDRLGRNYEEILNQWHLLTRNRDIDIVVLDMPLLDTRKDKDLTGVLISDLVLQILSYVAETERVYIRQRQAEGIQIAKEHGIIFGRPPKERPAEYENVKQRWSAGELSARKAAELLGITHRTFLIWVREENMVDKK